MKREGNLRCFVFKKFQNHYFRFQQGDALFVFLLTYYINYAKHSMLVDYTLVFEFYATDYSTLRYTIIVFDIILQ